MHFTDSKKKALWSWVRSNRQIKGMDKLYEQITRAGKANYNRDKDGFFFQTQITRQLAESKRYKITMVEDKGPVYDIDIELDGRVCIQAWFGGNVAGYGLDQKIKKTNSPLVLYSQRTCLDKDLNVLQDKLDQINRPALPIPSGTSADLPVKILVAMSRTLLPLHFPPEWGRHLKDRVIIELRGDFDDTGNMRGLATLHRHSRQWDDVAKGIVNALGFRYVESFLSLAAGSRSTYLGGLPNNAWHSYLHTASRSIRLQPKIMTSTINSDVIAGQVMDRTGNELSQDDIDCYLNSELWRNVSRVIWADVEQSDQDMMPASPCYPESIDRLIADRSLVKNNKPGLYNLYDGGINRDKTDVYDATVVDAGNGDLGIDHVECLLNGIQSRSNKTPNCFLGDPIVLWNMLDLGRRFGYTGRMVCMFNKHVVQTNSFMGIPTPLSYGTGPNKPGCIYAISYKDEWDVPSGLRLMESSVHEAEVPRSGAPNYRIAYAIGEAAVDPRACGKIINIRRRL